MSERSILIGDAGGTKTAWRLLLGNQQESFNTSGFNAFTHSIHEFANSIQENIPVEKPDRVVLYCAGADTAEQKESVAIELSRIFRTKPVIENDLLGAARATCNKESGYVCILGTGANASYYNGSRVEKVSASLGYVLGDEGSGAHMGKALLRGVYRGWLDQEVTDRFDKEFQLPVDQAITSIYNAEQPNKYLASFVPFISSMREHSQISQLIYDSFNDFFEGFFKKKTLDDPLHFVGSIAFYFPEILRRVATDLNYQIGNIVESPMQGLITYHQDEQ